MSQLPSVDFLDEHDLALALARNQLGMKLPVTELLEQIGIEPKYLLALSKNDAFRQMVKNYRAELEKDGEGIRLKSAVALEHSIPRLYSLVHNKDTPANVVVQGIKQMADMAGVTKPQEQAKQAGTGFQVNIDLSGLKEIAKSSASEAPTTAVIDISPMKEST